VIQFLLLPGLGSDGRVGYAQRSLPYNVITPDYILPFKNEELPAYAKRMLASLIAQKLIDLNAPIVLAGISMGGALAQEMSRLIEARAIVLLGSLRKGSELRPLIYWYGKLFISYVPLWVHDVSPVFVPMAMERLSNVSEQDITLSETMYRELPKEIFRTGLSMLARWQGCPITTPLFRIHGELDHIIPLERTTGVDLVVSGAKHLVAVSHPEIVNPAIEKFLKPLLDK
jgi:pimeloyl-ACP methyl ester carboxylesterase